MRTALSTQIERQWPLERHAEVAAEIGYDALEIVLSPPHATPAQTATNAAEIAAMLADHGLGVACVTSTALLDGSEAALDAVRAAVQVASLLGSATVKLPSARPSSLEATDEDFARCARALKEACRGAHAQGVVVTVETHLNMLTDTLGGTCRLLAEATQGEAPAPPGSLGVTYDITNVYTAREDPVAGVDRLREWIRLVHVKDGRLTPQGIEWCPIGLGEVDLVGALRRLKAVGYDGHASVECLLSAPAYVRPPELATPEDVARYDHDALRQMISDRHQFPT